MNCDKETYSMNHQQQQKAAPVGHINDMVSRSGDGEEEEEEEEIVRNLKIREEQEQNTTTTTTNNNVLTRCPSSPIPLLGRIFAMRLATDCALTKSILKQIFATEVAPGRLFNLTESQGQISLAMDEISLREIQLDMGSSMFVAPEAMRALPIKAGAGADTVLESGVICRLTAPLAAEKISMFYLGTVDEELILVDECELDRAIEALKKGKPSRRCDDMIPELESSQSASLAMVMFLNVKVLITSFAAEHITLVSNALIRAIFLSGPHKFFSYTAVGDRICLWMDPSFVDLFPQGVLSPGAIWRVIQIDHGTTCMVTSLAVPLAVAGLPMMYSSTYCMDYAAVLNSQVSEAATCLSAYFSVEIEGDD